MSLIGITPEPITPQQVLGNLLGITKDSAQSVEAGIAAQPRTVGLAVAASQDFASAQLAMGFRPANRLNPFAF